MTLLTKSGAVLLLAVLAALGVLYLAGGGVFGRAQGAGQVQRSSLAPELVLARGAQLAAAATHLGVDEPKQILFGDLHVHSSFSMDAFQLTLPIAGGAGAHPVADACDFARFCSNLDFWSINDHAASLTPRRWNETIRAVRECNAVSAGVREPDLTAFLGWEWTQMGSTPDNHYGHKNVVLRDLEDGAIPVRPIAAKPPTGVPSTFDTGGGGRLALGLGAFAMRGGHDMMRALAELQSVPACPTGVPERELPADCMEAVATPAELFAKLDDWGHASIVIPHGSTWGMYTPPASSWAKQLTPAQHDADRQRLVEIYSGHGNTEEFRPWVAAEVDASGARHCPEPGHGYTPSCWRAGEIIRTRCLSELGVTPSAADRGDATSPVSGSPDERAASAARASTHSGAVAAIPDASAAGVASSSAGAHAECDARAATARQNFVDADRNAGPWTVPGVLPHEFLDAGQCRDCFQPAFNYRPLGSVQYMLALSLPAQSAGSAQPASPAASLRFRFGFIASSDNHTGRAGTGYKERERREFTDARMGEVGRSSLVLRHRREPVAHSERFDATANIPSVAFLETERGGSFFLTGGLAAVHAQSRDRGDIWDALERRETYGTSGPRILLWFDFVDPTAGPRGVRPMGSAVRSTSAPTFRVRAAGSFEQLPGCADPIAQAVTPERLATLCRNECYHPSDERRPIDRIEVVRIRPQRDASEAPGPQIEDPWRVLPCDGNSAGCSATFTDPEFPAQARDTLYYVRAIERASPVVGADPLWCQRDASGRCVALNPCFDRPASDDCLDLSEQRAWSSPIFVDYGT